MKGRLLSLALVVYFPLTTLAGEKGGAVEDPHSKASAVWSPEAAARYLDSRAAWWQSWPKSQRDHETVCVSCHTMLPYALARPKLRAELKEPEVAGPERSMIQNVRKRVFLWAEVQPYYLDEKAGPGKSKESRSTEAVLNALVLASNNRGQKEVDPVSRKAFEAAWALQIKSGDQAGAWDWQIFHLAPWESKESQYQGATFMALAAGWAPAKYSREPAIQSNLELLRSYLRRNYDSQPLLNRIVVLWASYRLAGLLSKREKQELVEAIIEKQQPDGGWSLPSLGSWDRSDHTPQSRESDGYATGLVTLSLHQAGLKSARNASLEGRTWLELHQDTHIGAWRADSLNKKRDPNGDAGKFMSDAATGFAVLALESSH